MKDIHYEVITSDNIDFLEKLCNQLMGFQADHAHIRPDIMASMNYSNRLKPEYAATPKKMMLVAYEDSQPIGFAFATVSTLQPENLTQKPSWAQDLSGQGFYPRHYVTPKTIGTFKLLYLEEAYRGRGIGQCLCSQTMDWLKSQPAVEALWVYVANGNEAVGQLYETLGFQFSHDVYDGFIKAYHLNL